MTDSQHHRTDPARRFWPARPADLVDTTLCPSCFRTLDGPVCGFCGLDMRTPLSTRLLDFGRAMLSTEAERQATIDEMRVAASARADRNSEVRSTTPVPVDAPNVSSSFLSGHASPPPGPAVLAAATGPWPSGHGVPSAFAPVVPTTPTLPTHAGPTPPGLPGIGGQPPIDAAGHGASMPGGPQAPRRSAAQVLLLTAGVVLVSVFAVFFAVLAYVVASVELRSVLTAAASVIVLGIAWVLRSRRLAGTGEGVAAIGVVLLLLDVWIIRINRLFDVDRLDAWLYTGLAFLVLSALLIGAARLTGLRTPSVSAAVIAPIGVFALVVGSTAPVAADSTRALLGAVAMMLVVLLEFVTTIRPAERVMLRVAALLAGATAMVVAGTAFPSIDAGPTLAFVFVVIGWSAVIAIVHRPAAPLTGSAWRVLAAIGSAFAAGGLAVSAAHDLGTTAEAEGAWRVVLLGAIAGIVVVSARFSGGRLQRTLRIIAVFVASFTAFAILVPLSRVGTALASALSGPPFRRGPLDTVVDEPFGLVESSSGLAVTAALAAVVLLTAGSSLLRRYWAWVPVVVAAPAVAGSALAVSSGLASIAVLLVSAIAALAAGGWRRLGTTVRTAAVAVAIGLLVLTSWLASVSSGLWAGATLVVLLLLVAARALIAYRRTPATSTMSVVASSVGALVLLGAGGLAPSWAASIGILTSETPGGPGVAVAGSVVLIALSVLLGRARKTESIVVGSLASLATVGATVITWVLAAGFADTGWRIAVAVSVIAAAVAWTPRSRPLGTRIAAAAVTVPLATLIGAELARVLGSGLDPRSADGLGTLVAAVVLAIFASVVSLRSIGDRSSVPEVALARDVSLGVTTLVVAALSVVDGTPIGPLVLLVLAITPTLLAFRPVAGRYPRLHVGWAGVLLAVAALWWFLADESVGTVEYYSLPVAGLLLAIGASSVIAAVRRSSGGAMAQRRLVGTEIIVSASAAVAVLPSSALAGVGAPLRAIVLVAVGAVLLLVSLGVLRDTAMFHGRLIGWFTALGALALPLIVRALDAGRTVGGGSGADLLWWLAVVVLVVLVCAALASRIRPSSILVGSALTSSSFTILLVVPALHVSGTVDGVEATPWLVILCAIAVVASTASQRSVIWAAIVSAISAVILGAIMLPSVPHVEYVSVPVGVAAITAGALRLRRVPALRSWPALGPGLLLALLPSLFRDFGDTALWRVIAVGIVALVVLLVGVLARLQAPLVIGAVTVIAHGLAQLWPWISGLYEAGYWWLWAGIGGVILIVFAARYEQRMTDIRNARRALSALR